MATATFTTKPLLLNNSMSQSISSHKPQNVCMRKNGLRVCAVATKWEPSKVVPQADRVLVRLEQLPEKSSGGVLLPKSAVKFERYLMGEILSVGSEVEEVGAGQKVDLGMEDKHCFLKASDLLAVVE